jgi:hypothetical protein
MTSTTGLPDEGSKADLVERLMQKARSFAVIDETDSTITYADGAILVEAAEEINRLRAIVDEMTLDNSYWSSLAMALAAERDKS